MNRIIAIISSLLILSASQTYSQSLEADILSVIISANSDSVPPLTDVLDIISEAYADHNYFSSGGWDFSTPEQYNSSLIPPVSGIPFSLNSSQHISSNFGYRLQFNRMHYGIDIEMCLGDTIHCPMVGTVSRCGYDKGYGHYIIIVHDNGIETRYGHLSKILVGNGQRVDIKTPIALSGNSGRSTGPHLHLETRYLNSPIDPRLVFNFRHKDNEP